MRSGALLAAVLVAFPGQSLTGCAGDDASPVDTVQGSWQLTAMTVDDLAYPLGIPGRPDPTLDVEGHRASGSGGCNEFGAEVAGAGEVLTITMGYSTMIGCPGAVGETEAAYFDALDTVTSAALDGSDLALTGDGVSLTFRSAGGDEVQR